MKKIYSIRTAMIGLVLWAFVGVAQAIPVPMLLGNIGSSGIAPVDVALPANGGFSNTFTFTLLSGNSADISLLSFFSGDPAIDTPSLVFELFGASGAGRFVPNLFVDDLFLANMTFVGLTVGKQYTLGISGSDASYLGESYSLQMAARQLPEPATVVLVLACLGLVGARKRIQLNKRVAI